MQHLNQTFACLSIFVTRFEPKQEKTKHTDYLVELIIGSTEFLKTVMVNILCRLDLYLEGAYIQ